MKIFWNAFRVQRRVIFALILRETRTRYGKTRIGYLWALFEPLAHMLIFAAIFSFTGRTSPLGGSVALLVLTGLFPYNLFSNLSTQLMNAVEANKVLLSYPHVTPFDVMASRTILEVATQMIVFIFVLLILAIQNLWDMQINSFLSMLLVIFVGVALGAGMGLINAVLAFKFPSYANIFGLIMRPMYFLSGIFFVVGYMSSEIQGIMYYNPVAHLIEWFRSAIYVGYTSEFLDKHYLLHFTLTVLFLGLLLLRLSRHKIRQSK
ncbi:MAG TPA: polysialic acid transporter [Gammaproteobacteria bacterium]|nr:polysialic acid transporter [Gammaproteobacteria bacterium]